MSHTYFCTDKHGNVYHRYSDGHATPQYVAAVVTREKDTANPVHKASVSYTRTLKNAYATRDRYHGVHHRGWSNRPGWTAECEVVTVRAYKGRHKTEPARENA